MLNETNIVLKKEVYYNNSKLCQIEIQTLRL